MRHRSIRFTACLVLAISMLNVVTAPPALATHSVSIVHTPLDVSYAGNNVTLAAQVNSTCTGAGCFSIYFKLYWKRPDGSTRVKPLTLAHAASQQVSVTIDASDVRYPSMSYYMQATQTHCPVWIGGYVGCASNPPIHDHTGRWPVSGWHATPIQFKIPVTFKKPDGTPAAGARVRYALIGTSSTQRWETTTNSSGLAYLALPNIQALADRALTHKHAEMMVSVFDAVPNQAPTGVISVTGNGMHLGVTLNLGFASWSAVDPLVANKTFTLQSQTRQFWPHLGPHGGEAGPSPNGPPEGPPPGWNDRDCKYISPSAQECTYTYDDIYSVDVPLGKNVGGGSEMRSRVEYKTEVQTKVGFGVKLGYSGSWGEGGTELVAENASLERQGFTSTWYGPNDNRTYFLTFTYTHTGQEICWEEEPYDTDNDWTCEWEEKSTPKEWDSGHYGSANGLQSSHDSAQEPPDSEDWTVQSEGEYYAGKGTTKKYSFTLSATAKGVGPVTLGAHSTFSEESAIEFVQWWKVTASGTTSGKIHHRFVHGGYAGAANERGRAPNEWPGYSWTDTSKVRKVWPNDDLACHEVPGADCDVIMALLH